jgi:hypothetical protein
MSAGFWTSACSSRSQNPGARRRAAWSLGLMFWLKRLGEKRRRQFRRRQGPLQSYATPSSWILAPGRAGARHTVRSKKCSSTSVGLSLVKSHGTVFWIRSRVAGGNSFNICKLISLGAANQHPFRAFCWIISVIRLAIWRIRRRFDSSLRLWSSAFGALLLFRVRDPWRPARSETRSFSRLCASSRTTCSSC